MIVPMTLDGSGRLLRPRPNRFINSVRGRRTDVIYQLPLAKLDACQIARLYIDRWEPDES